MEFNLLYEKVMELNRDFKKLKYTISTLMISMYLLFSSDAFISINNSIYEVGVIDILRRAVLDTGLLSVLACIMLIFNKNDIGRLKIISLMLFVLFYHYFLFVVSAYYDGPIYWSLQAVEFFLLCFIYKITRVRKK